MFKNVSKSLATAMRNAVADEIEKFGDVHDEDRAWSRCRLIKEDNNTTLTSPLVILRYLEGTVSALKTALPPSNAKLVEEDVERVVLDFAELLGGLLYIRTDLEKEQKSRLWDKKKSMKRLNDLHERLQRTLHLDCFNEEKAAQLGRHLSQVGEDCKALETRLNEDLPNHARLHMSTIGSSHKLPIAKKKDIVDMMDSIHLDASDDEEEDLPKKTVVIFDEAGCIPSYELLGLSRLGRDIEALVLVGDEHQLPPYNASQGGNNNQRGSRRGGYRSRRTRETPAKALKSLLDASALTIDNSKVMLTTQYRVPKDIADILNARVYKGAYNTCSTADVPLLGLNVIHVDEDPNPRKKYVNSNEVEKGLRLVDELILDNRISDILIITPVSIA